MNKGKQEKGITLIALVITIVILLILSAVVINMALGNGGLAQKAKEATENYKLAEQAEMESIAEIEEELNNLDYGGGGGRRRYNICRKCSYSKWIYSITNKYRRFRRRRIGNI